MVRLAVLCEYPHAPQGALLTGDVQRHVSTEVPDLRVASGLEKGLGDLRLIRDHGQVQRRLGAKQDKSGISQVPNAEQGPARTSPAARPAQPREEGQVPG